MTSSMNESTRRILLVEDEKAIRDAVAAYLERENYWVTAVGDGQEALEEFSKHHFDLVVLDLMLPRVPGERVCRVIRDSSDTPIIMLTAKGEVEDRIIGLELGADDYLIKPFSPRELVARVRALLRRVHSESEPQREVLEFGELYVNGFSTGPMLPHCGVRESGVGCDASQWGLKEYFSLKRLSVKP